MSDTFTLLVEHCGRDVAEAVLQHFSGLRIYVPRTWTPEHMLNLLGEQHAEKLIEQFARTWIEVPHHRRGGRKRLARALHEAGHNRNAVAKATGYTERHVRRLVADGEDDEPQGRLF